MDLVGVWRLTEWVKVHTSGEEVFPFTADAMGRIIYSPAGWMSGFLMHPHWHLNGPLSGVQSAGLIAYSGRFEIDGEMVSHFVDIASEPRWIGMVLKRYGLMDGHNLTLKTSLSRETADPAGWLHHRLIFKSES